MIVENQPLREFSYGFPRVVVAAPTGGPDVPTYLQKSLVKGVRLLFELSTKIPEGYLPYFIIQYADQVFVATLAVGHGITLLRRTCASHRNIAEHTCIKANLELFKNQCSQHLGTKAV